MKRIKVNRSCANPLFVKWLEEWKEEAASRRSAMENCFSKALKTMKKCPLRLERGRDCIILQNFGNKLCQMLDRKLSEHKANGGTVAANSNDIDYDDYNYDKEKDYKCDEEGGSERSADLLVDYRKDFKAENLDVRRSIPPGKEKRRKESNDEEPRPGRRANAKGRKNGEDIVADKENRRNGDTASYIPAWRSGGYAILLTLYEKTLERDYVGYMGKADLQLEAQKYSDKSLRKAEPGSRYTAWSSMSILIEKGLVVKKSSPAQYRLTDAGFATALQLSEIDDNDSESGVRSEINDRAVAGSSASVGFENPFSKSSGSTVERNANHETFNTPIIAISGGSPGSKSSDKLFTGEMRIDDDIVDDDIEPVDVIDEKKKRKNIKEIIGDRNGIEESANSLYDYTLVLAPHTFDVLLIIDDRETAGGKTRPKDDPTISELSKTGIKYEIRNLKIGDFLWIARSRSSREELVLPYIVERKRIDDFGSSIKDGRYYEQKFRLKKSAIRNVTYLVENHGNNQYSVLPVNTLFQAAINTLVQDGFNVKWTDSHKDSMIYLASMTHMLNRIYQGKTLIASKKDDLTISGVLDDSVKLMYFKEFNKSAAKVKAFKSKEMFIRQLIQLRGLSIEKALAIVDIYPTPVALKKAYEIAGTKGESLLAGIQINSTKRQLGPALSKTLHQFYTRKDF